MGGSGGGGAIFSKYSPEELQREIRNAELRQAEEEFSPNLSRKLNEFLRGVNDRDAELTNRRLEQVKEILRNELEHAIALKFGGSVAKHTYVDGLSDVDLLLVLKGANANLNTPQPLLNEVTNLLSDGLGREVEVSRGRIAITLKFRDGEEIQLIPAIRNDSGMHVPSWTKDGWSAIDPDGFQKALVKYNEKCGSKLVPTIKLAKAINATLPDAQQLTGYHIESMAINTFKHYDGPFVVEKMLPRLAKTMSELVKTPIRDSSGQSVHVDEYLGRPNSEARKRMSHVLDRIYRRMENATAARSLEQWSAILGE